MELSDVNSKDSGRWIISIEEVVPLVILQFLNYVKSLRELL